MDQMYPGISNSPSTTLSHSCGAADQTLYIANPAAVPTGPNLCTLGTGSAAETVQYMAISGNTLTGVTRGFDGTTAQAWPSQTAVTRFYTNYDHQSFIDNINDLSSAVTQVETNVTNMETTLTGPLAIGNISGQQIDPATAEGLTQVDIDVQAVGTALGTTNTELTAINGSVQAVANDVNAVDNDVQTLAWLLKQLLAKVPPGMTVGSANELRVLLSTNSTTNVYDMSYAYPGSKLVTYEGQFATRQIWQQQRSLITI